METIKFSGKLTGSWKASPAWVGFDQEAVYNIYQSEDGVYTVVGCWKNVRKNEWVFNIRQFNTKITELEVEKKVFTSDPTDPEPKRFGGKYKGRWHLPPACFKGEKEVAFTVYESKDGSYTIVGEWKEVGKEECTFIVYQFSSFGEATDSEIGKMLPLCVF